MLSNVFRSVNCESRVLTVAVKSLDYDSSMNLTHLVARSPDNCAFRVERI